ncbi:flagellar hook-basal body complex protein FlhP [Paraliobacillus quinghaiensis]|uniref:Flagellar hook-basal body complex protein FlhP n=1 Tax=Paraliobacillus quinghaiensis TaxID=470815 RepID=A0A917TPU7_9BACI|nr:flagellar hook-basal body protein [Paraliobacillus quinghaiensis]GGM32417.1 flagellar hook-basal body complex protein FlhP [Paraliobacillus quinghaiensis]
MNRMAIQAAVTMGQLQNKLDVVGHNLANVDTTGYKNRSAEFSSLLFQQIDNFNGEEQNVEGRLTPAGIRLGSGAKLGSTAIDLSVGATKITDRGLDVTLLEDNHLLQVDVTENGVTERRYTRDGSLYLNTIEDGQLGLTTSDGHPVVGENGPIILAEGADDVSITKNGAIQVTRNGQTETEGNLAIVQAIRPQMLEAAGANQFRLPDITEAAFIAEDIIQGVALNDVQIQTGALEDSNVDLATQMTEMMQTQRAYQFNSRSISMSDQMSGLVNQLR